MDKSLRFFSFDFQIRIFIMKTDEEWMNIALKEAVKAEGCTSPNPLVGAVLVKNGVELGKGYHHKAGQLHAEREALADAYSRHSKDDLIGATIYVTLEPCSTKGKTPPCVSGIIDAGIKKVVYGAVDLNPAHRGVADKILAEHGIGVISGVERETCELLLRPFHKRITQGLPWVIAKTAMSLDGKITRPFGESQWLTSPEAREVVHQLRAKVDAIVVGGRTVRKDNPKLTLRGEGLLADKIQPYRVVLTHAGRSKLPDEAHIFNDEFKERTIVMEDIPMPEVLKHLAELGCNSVLLECGGRLMSEFVDQDLIDEYAIFYAPMVTGGEDLGFGGVGIAESEKAQKLKEIQYTKIGNDILVQGVVKREEEFCCLD